MWKALLYKWFGLEDLPCQTCEVLKEQLSIERQFNKVLFAKLTDKPQAEPVIQETEKPIPITPAFVPWRVRQQLLEAEDSQKAKLMREKAVEIEALEKELGVSQDASA